MDKQPTAMLKERSLDTSPFSLALKNGQNHSLIQEDFFDLVQNKEKERVEKRIPFKEGCELLLKNTIFKGFKICIKANVGYWFHSGKLYGAFSSVEIKELFITVLQKVGDERLLRPYFISKLLEQLKRSEIGVHGQEMLSNLREGKKTKPKA